MLKEDNATTTLLLVNIHWAGEASARCFLPCPQGQTVSQAAELFSEQWDQCVQTLQAEDPDDDWGIDDVVDRMKQKGWHLDSFAETIEVEV